VNVFGGNGCAVILDIEESVGRGGIEDLLCNLFGGLRDVDDRYTIVRDCGWVHVG